MSETETDPSVPAAAAEPTAEGAAPKTPKKRGGNRQQRKPKLKDWLRVIKSQGNGQPNLNIHLIVNQATGLVEVETQANAKEGSTELEAKRTQVFKITSYDVINDPTRDPLAAIDENGNKLPEGETNAAEPAAPTA